jgi:hypothetical protein
MHLLDNLTGKMACKSVELDETSVKLALGRGQGSKKNHGSAYIRTGKFGFRL